MSPPPSESYSGDVLQRAEFVAARFALIGVARAASKAEVVLMTKLENRCAYCGGKFGLVWHQHWRLRFCRKACKDNFLAKMARDRAHIKKLLGYLSRGTT